MYYLAYSNTQQNVCFWDTHCTLVLFLNGSSMSDGQMFDIQAMMDTLSNIQALYHLRTGHHGPVFKQLLEI